jgi:hypothetical protein
VPPFAANPTLQKYDVLQDGAAFGAVLLSQLAAARSVFGRTQRREIAAG